MRKILFTIIFLLSSTILLAQEEMETLIGGSIKITGFQSGLSLKMTTAKGIPLAFVGAEGALLLNRQVKLGISASHNLRLGKFLTEEEGDFNMFYVGGIVGYIFNPNKVIHLSTDLFIGGGQVYSLGQNSVAIANFLVLEPQLDLEFNITRFSKLGIGGGIRGIRSIYDETLRISEGPLTAPYITLGLKIGKFN